MKLTSTNPEYAEFLTDLKNRIAGARVSAARTVNREMILLYWDIGRGIVEKQKQLGWGKSLVDPLAVDLYKEVPALEGCSASNLWRMRQLYAALTAPDFLAQAVREMERSPILRQIVAESSSPQDASKWRQPVAKLPNGCRSQRKNSAGSGIARKMEEKRRKYNEH